MNLIRALESGSISNDCRPGFRQHFTIWVLGLCALFLFASCNSKKYLTADQSFLYSNKIKIKSKHNIDDKADLKEKLALKYQQEAPRGVIPRHIFYYQYMERLKRDSLRRIEYLNKGLTPPRGRKKWSNEKLIRNRPVIYDSVKAELTTEEFEKYLNLRGYRYAEASFNSKTTDKETTVTYKVDPGPRLYIDTFSIATTDSSLRRIIDERMGKTYFTEGSPLDIELYNDEKSRIVVDLQNEGYALFDETFIAPLEVDTAGNYVSATLRILDQNDSTFHKQFYVGTITVYPDYELTDTSALSDTVINGIHYIFPQPEMTLRPEAIERNVFLKHDELSRRVNLSQTLKNLSRMELIKFVTPDVIVDTSRSDRPYLNYAFFLSRNRKINLNGFAELTYASITQRKRSLLGASVSGNYRDLNFLKGAEILSVNVEAGVEFNFFNRDDPDDREAINSENYGLGTNLSFPRFMDPFRLYHMIGHTRTEDKEPLVGGRLRKWLLYDASTRLNVSYSKINILELYKYYTINVGLSYDIVPDEFRKLSIDRIGFDLYVPTPTDDFFTDVLSKSRLLQESFRKYLFSGLLFRKYSFDLNPAPRRKAGYFRLIHGMEISGLEVYLMNLPFENEFVLGRNSGNGTSNEIEFSHFAKGEVDVRFYYNFSSSTQFALKFNTGLVTPFGRFSQQVPYVKQFYVGGPLSNRAWQIRELGPGSYKDPDAEDVGFAFYQTGDIKLDMSAEFRFPLFWYFDGAIFIDAANVWTIREDTSRVGSNFELKEFLQELGVGYGFGIRLDLDFFIIRLDMGYKLLSPYPLPETGKKQYPQQFPNKGVAQIAVGLPF